MIKSIEIKEKMNSLFEIIEQYHECKDALEDCYGYDNHDNAQSENEDRLYWISSSMVELAEFFEPRIKNIKKRQQRESAAIHVAFELSHANQEMLPIKDIVYNDIFIVPKEDK